MGPRAAPSLSRELAAALALLVPAAVAIGVVEAAWRVAGGELPIGGARLLPAAALLYGVLGVAQAVAQVAVRRLLAGTPLGRAVGGVAPWHVAVALAFGIAAAVALPLHRELLADAFGAASLAFNGVLLLGVVPLLARLLQRPSAALLRAAAGTGGRLATRAFQAALAVTCAAPLFFTPPGLAIGERGADAGGRPNVLLLVLDTLRADHLGCYGYARATSPNLDALAAKSVLFEECFAQAPHTKPSMASLLTGRLPPRHGVEAFGASLPPDEQPLAELLHAAGYRTGLFSANAFVAPTFGFAQGIERYVGPLVSPAAPLAAFHVLARLRDVWVEALHLPERPWQWYEALVSLPFDRAAARHDPRAAELHDELLRFVAAEPTPWFAQVQLMETHAPYRPRLEHRCFDGAAAELDLPETTRHLFLPFARAEPLPPESLAALVATYDACIRDVDAEVGALLAQLEERGALDDTVVIVVADHGEEFYDHGGFGHGHSLHRELLRVPLIVNAPARLPAGRRVPTQVRSLDLLPTLLELLELELPGDAPPLDGESLLPLLRMNPDEPPAPRAAFASVQWGGSSALSSRDGTRTVIVAREGGEERVQSFDPRADPQEQHDLAATDPREAESARATAAALTEFAKAAAAQAGRSARDATLDPATKSLLKALGYAGE
ncbi:MAG: sulfatase-like hydrolase/transferase [Planctomycetes bacterium]|nr:sulfatase-like hydrolase/transferase [Planctomycetota bacterium]